VTARHLYPGEMDRYADRLDEAATNGDAAKMRPALLDDHASSTDVPPSRRN